MSEKKSITAGEAFTESARWLNSIWKNGNTAKVALVTVGVFTPLLLLVPAVGYCIGTAKTDEATKATEETKD